MKSKKITKAYLLGIIAATTVCLVPSLASAKASGPCSDCHTMHNSQDGVDLSATAYGALTKGDCIGCHTGINVADGNKPYVLQIAEPTYDPASSGTAGGSTTLAGGSFWWVSQTGGNAKGHNVVDVAAEEDTVIAPPGWDETFDANGRLNNGAASWTAQITCAGTNGCHGLHETAGLVAITNDWDSLSGSHHASDDTIDGTTVATSYRFLKGILGTEDSDWEFQPTATAHNQYYGEDKTSDLEGNADTATISYLCAECHGDFHSGVNNLGAASVDATPGSPWIRHPSDYDMGNVDDKIDYAGYGGGTHIYSVIAPVASTDVSVVLGTVYGAAGGNDDAIVTCISCHRAHGTPYDDLLRWDYATCSSGDDDAACGCFQCHTTKDAG